MSSAEPDFLLAKAKQTVEQKRRVRIVGMILPGVLGGLLFVVHSMFYGVLMDSNLVLPVGLLSIGLIGVSAGFVVINYLQTGFALTKEYEVEAELAKLKDPSSMAGMLGPEIRMLKIKRSNYPVDELSGLRDEVEKIKGIVDSDAFMKISEADSDFRRAFLNNSAAEIADKANAILASKVHQSVSSSLTCTRFEECRVRLMQEIRDLNRKGDINLAIGAGISAAGILLLGVTLVYETAESKDIISLVSHYLPRLSLIILIEVLAYFFLRLYKAGLAEVKYFQNELTNIEAKQIATDVAREAGDNTLIGVVVTKLAETERNHVLTKDQTTVELEKARLESDSKVAFGKFVTDFFQKVKPSS
ncbi:hypothetical protein [Pseudomonas sp. HLS-6 TE3448]